MKLIDRTQLIDHLNWRYATKQYDQTRKIGSADWATLEEALVLSPSSLGLQPWAFLVVDDPAARGPSRFSNLASLRGRESYEHGVE